MLAWVETNGCDPELSIETLPEGVTRRDYECAGDSALIVYIHPGGHSWPWGEHGLDANTIIWEYLEQYTEPLPTR